LFNSEVVLHESCVKLELFIYRVIVHNAVDDIEKGYTLLKFIESLTMSHSTSLLSGICKYYDARTNQIIVQMLPFPTTNEPNVPVIQRYRKHLDDGTKLDAVTGWLLYASFYYVRRQYKKALKIIDHVLSRCTRHMLMLGDTNYTTSEIKYYSQNVGCLQITLSEKMKKATIDNVICNKQSTLIPPELRLDVQDGCVTVPPFAMSHCLKFLCHHHLYDIVDRQQSLIELFRTIKDMHFVSEDQLSDLLTILGVCNEIVGDIESANYHYDAALECEYQVCRTAAARKVNLNMNIDQLRAQNNMYRLKLLYHINCITSKK
jgi:Mg2+ and Co2+ transporter CorA